MLADILRHYNLATDFNRAGFYESKELIRVESILKEHISLGHCVALTGPVGAGKTMLIRRVISELKKSGRVLVSESLAIEKERINLTSIAQALCMDFDEKPGKDRMSRDRKLIQIIERSPQRIVFFIDDAHQVQAKTLLGLNKLVESGLCVVLIGQPPLVSLLASGQTEEIGIRYEKLEIHGLAGETGAYLEWLIEQAGGQIGIFSAEAREELAQVCRTPLQMQWIALGALKQG